MTYVTCPTFRYHPAVVAQKAATMQILLRRAASGSGWARARTSTSTSSASAGRPSASATRCWRRRWTSSAGCSTASTVNYRGSHFDVESARLWDLPDERVPIGIAVSGQRRPAGWPAGAPT